MTRPLPVAVVGAGHLGRIHARLLSSLADVELVGVVDPYPEPRQSVATEVGTDAYETIEQIKTPISAAIIATPTAIHEEIALDLLGRGIHVFVEKPLAATVSAARRIDAKATAHQCTLQVGHVERFNPAVEIARQHTHDPKFIEVRRVCPHSFRSTDIGVVHDLMIHDIDLLLSIIDSPVVRVNALGASIFGDSEDIAQAQLQFASGCIANVVASRVSLSAERSMNIFMPTGYVGVDMQQRQVNVVKLGERIQEGFSLAEIRPEERLALRDQLFNGLMHQQKLEVPDQNALLEELKDFVGAINQQRAPRVDGRAAIAALEVAAQVLESIGAHQWDGRDNGRVGPFGLAPHEIIRDPRLVERDEVSRRQKAG